MSGRRHRRHRLELGGTAAVALAGAALERRHLRRIVRDPEQARLASPPSGEPLAVRSADGTQLHAEVFGAGELTFVLAHGWTEMLSFWTYVIDELCSHGFRVVAYDLRGHGQSEPAHGGDYAVARFGEDLEAVLAAAVPEGQRAIVAGHSLGAMSVAAWAEHHDVPRRACAAALLNTGVGDPLADSLLIPLPALANLLNRLAPTALVAPGRACPRSRPRSATRRCAGPHSDPRPPRPRLPSTSACWSPARRTSAPASGSRSPNSTSTTRCRS